MAVKLFHARLVSSLEKVFTDEEPKYCPECSKLTGLWGETVSFQIAYARTGYDAVEVDIKLKSEIAEHIRIRSVERVPVNMTVRTGTDGRTWDDNYLKTTAGMYPDVLRDLEENKIFFMSWKWNSLWIDVELTDAIPAGEYPIEFDFERNGEVVCSVATKIQVIGVELPKQDLVHTEWFHPDALVDYYRIDALSEEHWTIWENFLQEYAKRGCNMIMVPLYTLPLDTGIGLERTTVQLIKVKVQDGKYEINFDNVKRFVDMCQRCGIEYFEMCHLFSQWGARYAPKIMAEVDGKEEKIFGWHTPAVGEYTTFLQTFLPALTAKLKEWGIAEKCYFHVSDEPNDADMETYMAARTSIGNMLDGFKTLDAVSHYEFYEKGLVDVPVPTNDVAHEFLDHDDLRERWVYYCGAQFQEVSNRFMAMPSARNRILGVQLYKYEIAGFLHWGYNFYNTRFSTRRLNPYMVTDAGARFPSGDSFLVYPGEGGVPEESLRMMVLNEALNDLRALRFLESLTSREFVLDLVEGDLAEPITFKCYPKSDMYLITLRNRVNKEIAKRACK